MEERGKPNLFPLPIEANTEEKIRKQSETLSVQLLYGIGDTLHMLHNHFAIKLFPHAKTSLNIR